MALDSRACRTATTSLLFGLALLPMGLILQQVPLPTGARELAMISSGCWLLGGWLLLFANVASARHVLLDAHGRLPIRAPKPRREKKAKAPAEEGSKESGKAASNSTKRRDDLTTRIDPAHNTSIRPTTSGIDLQKTATAGYGKPQPAAAKVTAGTVSPPKVTQFISGRDEDQPQRSGKLSRAERKRLRKQERAGRLDDE
jgi:hypothetical protein